MSQIVFYISLLSIAAILILSLLAFVSENFSFFPPPSKDSWQYRTFWMLFRIMFIGLLYLSFSEFSLSRSSVDSYATSSGYRCWF